VIEVAPKGGPPLHVHHKQEETIHALKGNYKIQIGDETFHCEEGGFAYLPSGVPHASLNLTDEPGEIVVVVYTPAAATNSTRSYAHSHGTARPTAKQSPRSSRTTT
jgi:quercetin dioxygenase-like cupin family protein